MTDCEKMKQFFDIYDNLEGYTDSDKAIALGAWQARGELDAVRIEELEVEVNYLKSGIAEVLEARIVELTAKLDKAREAFGEIVLGKVYDQDIKDFCQTTLEELDK